MANNMIPLSQIVGDFILTSESDDYTGNVSDVLVRNFALRGIRQMGFDISRKIKSKKLEVSATNTVTLPEDFVDLIKVGLISQDGKVYVFAQDSDISFSDGPTKGFGSDVAVNDTYDSFVFRNFLYESNQGNLYGLGGGHKLGHYRLNMEESRIEIDSSSDYSEVVLEYVADQAKEPNPDVHVYAEEALRAYIYYRVIERKSTVPMGEKQRARQEYYNELRKANARMKSFSKEDALQVIRKNFKMSPKV